MRKLLLIGSALLLTIGCEERREAPTPQPTASAASVDTLGPAEDTARARSAPAAKPPPAVEPAPGPKLDPALRTRDSAHDHAETVSRLEAALEEKGLKRFATIPHHEGAKSVDLELRPTTLLIFGNPKLGTVLMQAGPTAGLDLPMRALVWTDDEGTHLTWRDPAALAAAHGITDQGPRIAKATTALNDLATAATE